MVETKGKGKESLSRKKPSSDPAGAPRTVLKGGKNSRHLQSIHDGEKRYSTPTMPPTQPLRESDILFPSASTSIKTTLLDLKRSNLSIHNRLTSISADGAFVAKVAEAFQLPLIANERCGSWYIDPALKAGSAYFKSTDGHFGEWSFSLRRLNLGVLEVVGGRGG